MVAALAVSYAFLCCQNEVHETPHYETTTLFYDDGTSGSSVWNMDKWHEEYDYYIVHDCDSAVLQTINTIYLPELANTGTDRIILTFEYELYINSLLGPKLTAGLSMDGSNFTYVWVKSSEGSGTIEIAISGWNDKQVYLRFLATDLAPVDGAILRSIKIEHIHQVE
jgi:hypothetical protein